MLFEFQYSGDGQNRDSTYLITIKAALATRFNSHLSQSRGGVCLLHILLGSDG